MIWRRLRRRPVHTQSQSSVIWLLLLLLVMYSLALFSGFSFGVWRIHRVCLALHCCWADADGRLTFRAFMLIRWQNAMYKFSLTSTDEIFLLLLLLETHSTRSWPLATNTLWLNLLPLLLCVCVHKLSKSKLNKKLPMSTSFGRLNNNYNFRWSSTVWVTQVKESGRSRKEELHLPKLANSHLIAKEERFSIWPTTGKL